MGSPTCPYCMQRADRCACEDPRIVGYENAPPTPPAPAPEVCGFCGITTPDFVAVDGTKYECRDRWPCIDRARKACGLPPKPTPAPAPEPSVTLTQREYDAMRAVVEAAGRVIDDVRPDFWNDDPPTDDTDVAYAIDYALLDGLRAALRDGRK